MSNNIGTWLARAAVAVSVVAMSGAVAGCGDDDPVTPPVTRYAPITAFNGNTDFDKLNFRGANNLAIDTLAYGSSRRGNATVSSATTVNVERQGGQLVGSASPNVDTNRLVWVIAASTADEVLSFSDPRPATSSQAKVRLINASKNAGALDLKITIPDGAAASSNISYNVGSSFASVDPAITKFVVTKAGTSDSLTVLPVTLSAGKIYTVIVYGSAATNATRPLAATIVEEQ